MVRKIDKSEVEVAASRARDILPIGLLHHRRHGEHSHSRLQEDCFTHRRQAEQAIQQDAALAQMQTELFAVLFSNHVPVRVKIINPQSCPLTLCYTIEVACAESRVPSYD